MRKGLSKGQCGKHPLPVLNDSRREGGNREYVINYSIKLKVSFYKMLIEKNYKL